MTRAWVAGILILVASASSGVTPHAQTAWPDLAARIVGEWAGQGVVTGRASEVSMSWSRDVGDAFLHLRFRNSMAAGGTRPAELFEARGYYRFAGTTTGTGTWVDSRGVIFPLVVTVDHDAMVVDWGGDTTERGRTRYQLKDATTLEVVDSVRSADGQYREFGRMTLKRTR